MTDKLKFDFEALGRPFDGIALYHMLGGDAVVDIELRDTEGREVTKILFHCNPNFPNYENINTKSGEELIARAIELLNSAQVKVHLDGHIGNPTRMLLRFNQPELNEI